MTVIDRLRRLTGREGVLLAAALVLLPLTALRLRVTGFGRLSSMAAPGGEGGHAPAATGDASRVRATARMVAAAAHHGPFHATCLPQSLVVQWLLRRQGIPSRLQLGVRKENGVLGAHAWVEYRGEPVIDSPDVRRRFAAFGPAEPERRPAPRGTP